MGLHAHTPEDTHTPFKYLLLRLLSLADLACPRCRQVCILMGVEPSWAQSKRLLGDPSFIATLKNYDKDAISPTLLRKLGHYVSKPSFDPDSVGRAAKAARGMAKWVRGMATYASIRTGVEIYLPEPPPSAQPRPQTVRKAPPRRRPKSAPAAAKKPRPAWDDGTPSRPSVKPKITNALLLQKIQALARTPDFEALSLQGIRQKLSEELKQDVTPHKDKIKRLVIETMRANAAVANPKKPVRTRVRRRQAPRRPAGSPTAELERLPDVDQLSEILGAAQHMASQLDVLTRAVVAMDARLGAAERAVSGSAV